MQRALAECLEAAADADPPDWRWGLLPEAVRASISEGEWQRAARAHSLGVQGPWSTALGGDEASYLEELLRKSREKCMLYPYHLADALGRNPRLPTITPFDYYQEMLIETMRAEKSFDTIPNFTAADCGRLVGVGRNEFLHALNQCRSKGWLWKRRRAIIASSLPAAAALPTMPVLHWWQVHLTKAAHKLLAQRAAARAQGAARPESLRSSIGERISQALSSVKEAREAAAAHHGASGAAAVPGAVVGTASGGPVPPPTPAPQAASNDEDELGAMVGAHHGAEGADDEGAVLGAAVGGSKEGLRAPDHRGLSSEQLSALGALEMAGGTLPAGELPRDALPALYSLGLVRYDVPVSASDRIAVPPLSGFVMNRVGHDYLEKMLYEVFVSNDEAMHVGEVASLLGQPLPRILRAVSIACLLGFAIKLTAPPLSSPPPPRPTATAKASTPALAEPEPGAEPKPLAEPAWHPSWHPLAEGGGACKSADSRAGSRAHIAEGGGDTSDPADACDGASAGAGMPQPEAQAPADEGTRTASEAAPPLQRIGLLVDSKLAACLMMSNLADGLKQHAVTLYEVGKIPNASDGF